MISKQSEELLNRALDKATQDDHEHFTVEHVAWGLFHEKEVIYILKTLGVDTDEMLFQLEDYLDQEIPRVAQSAELPQGTLAVQRLVQRALFHVQSSGKREVLPLDLFVSLFQAKESFILYLLRKAKIDRLEVLKLISHSSEEMSDVEEAAPSEEGELTKPGALAKFTVDLNELARSGKIDPLIGREKELERVLQTLCRRNKNNPLLVGEAGVGKTAIAEGLALKIVQNKVPEILANSRVFSLDMGALVAGTKYRGDFESRIKGVLKELQAIEKSILFIDEIHTLIGAGEVGGGSLDGANLLKPLLHKGAIRCMGSTTYQEFRTIFEKDKALVRRFQKVEVAEPSTEQTIEILRGLKPELEKYHQVTFSEEAIEVAVHLTQKHIHDRFLPDKAIDALDEAGARASLFRKKKSSLIAIDDKDIERIVSHMARIPVQKVSTTEKERLKSLKDNLSLAIFGQDQSVDSVVSAIYLSQSQLRNGDKPIGCFLFCGPTGVGKTELTRQLAMNLNIEFLRFDMSEYMEKHSVSRLIGAPPGYVGFDQAGLLTDKVLKHPHSVILLDEIEKAHPDILNLLLQVMDHGTLTDSNGRKVDFTQSILIMTSNVGSQEISKKSLGIGPDSVRMKSPKTAVENTFTPEFRNRLDGILYFNALDVSAIEQVLHKTLCELESQLLRKNIEIEFDEKIKSWLAKKGYDPLLGARPMARLIEDKIKKPLSEEILFGKLEKGGKVLVTLNEKADPSEPSFKFSGRKISKKDSNPKPESSLAKIDTSDEESQ